MIGETDLHIPAVTVPIKKINASTDIESETSRSQKTLMGLVSFFMDHHVKNNA